MARSENVSHLSMSKRKKLANASFYTFSGKRIKRGLYRCNDGSIGNADINGAANIIRKVLKISGGLL